MWIPWEYTTHFSAAIRSLQKELPIMFTVISSLSVCGGMRLGQAVKQSVRQSTGEQTSDKSKVRRSRQSALPCTCGTVLDTYVAHVAAVANEWR